MTLVKKYDWAPGRPKYKTEAERNAARVESTLRCRAKHKERYNEYMKTYHRSSYSCLRDKVLDFMGSKCQHCGYTADRRALQIDHIDGAGRKERRHIGWLRFFTDILAGKPGYQLLCANCNYIKRYDNNEVHFVDITLRVRQEENIA